MLAHGGRGWSYSQQLAAKVVAEMLDVTIHEVVILSEAKDLLSSSAGDSRSFASLRMTTFL